MRCTTMASHLLCRAREGLDAAASALSPAAELVGDDRLGGEAAVDLGEAVPRHADAVEAVIGRLAPRRDEAAGRPPRGRLVLPDIDCPDLALSLLGCALEALDGAGADLSLAALLISEKPAGNDAGLLAGAVGREAERLVGLVERGTAERWADE